MGGIFNVNFWIQEGVGGSAIRFIACPAGAKETRGTPTVPLGCRASNLRFEPWQSAKPTKIPEGNLALPFGILLPPRGLGLRGEFGKSFGVAKFSREATNFAKGKVSFPRTPGLGGGEGYCFY